MARSSGIDPDLDVFLSGRSAPRQCACGCGLTFVPPPSAPHKRFATYQCRMRHYANLRKESVAILLRTARGPVQDREPADEDETTNET